jgi:hypothetical protein
MDRKDWQRARRVRGPSPTKSEAEPSNDFETAPVPLPGNPRQFPGPKSPLALLDIKAPSPSSWESLRLVLDQLQPVLSVDSFLVLGHFHFPLSV